MIGRLARLRSIQDLGGNIPAQMAATELIPDLDAVIRRRVRDLQARQDHLRTELLRHLPGWEVPPVDGGQTLWVRLPRGDGASFAQIALRHGVALLPGAGPDPTGQSSSYVRLHFCLPRAVLSEAAAQAA